MEGLVHGIYALPYVLYGSLLHGDFYESASERVLLPVDKFSLPPLHTLYCGTLPTEIASPN